MDERSSAARLEPLGKRSVRSEIGQEPARRLRDVFELVPSAHKKHAAGLVGLRLIEAGERRRQEPPHPGRSPEVVEVRLKEVENKPVALAELASPAAEDERLRVARRRGDANVELVLDAERPQPDVVEARAVQFALSKEVRHPQRAEEPLRVSQANRMLLNHDVPEEPVVNQAVVPPITGTA